MALFNVTYCQIFERLITEEQWSKHLYSSRNLHGESSGYRPAYFPRRKLTTDECNILENAFWDIIFGSVDVLPV